MHEEQARALLTAERARLQQLLADSGTAAQDDRSAERDPGDLSDGAAPLTAEAGDDAVEASLRDRLAAVDRAEARLAAGTYGLSVRSGQPIPDERLEADPAAELTVEEAGADER